MFPLVGKILMITVPFSIWHDTGGHHPNKKARKRNVKRIQFVLIDIIEYCTKREIKY